MKLIFNTALIIFLCHSYCCLAQDTLCYCNFSHYHSDCYYFQKTEPNTNKGKFEKIMDFDDGQHFYGSGTYIRLKGKIILDSFKVARTKYEFVNGQKIVDNSVNDTTAIPTLTFYDKSSYLLLYNTIKKKFDSKYRYILLNRRKS